MMLAPSIAQPQAMGGFRKSKGLAGACAQPW